MCLIRNCKLCSYYQYEEVGDSDFGPVYSNTLVCEKNYDYNENTDELKKDFNYESEKECCVIDFYKIIEIDKELENMFSKEMNSTEDCQNTYKRFLEKYRINEV